MSSPFPFSSSPGSKAIPQGYRRLSPGECQAWEEMETPKLRRGNAGESEGAHGTREGWEWASDLRLFYELHSQ